MKNNFLSKAYGGVMEARHKLNGLGLPRQWKVITSTLLLLFTFAIGNVWGAETVLFTQNFSGVTPQAYRYTSGTVTETYSYSASGTTLSGLVGTGANLFTSLESSIKKGDIAINSATGGNNVDATGIFRVYSNGDNATQYSLVRTANFATTAPTALKVTFDIKFKNLSSGSNTGISFAIGSGFTDNSLSLESASNVHSGFGIIQGSTPYLTVYGSNTKFTGNPSITSDTWMSVVWVINNTGDKLKYGNPTGSGQTELNDDCFDIWIKQTTAAEATYTCIVSNQAANTPAKDLQNIFIGNAEKKKHELGLDNIVVTDLTPATATYDATFADGGHGSAPAAATGVSSVTLTEITGVVGWKNTGWTADKATKVGTTDKDAGATLNIGDEVTLLQNTTFTAQWAQTYTVTYNKAAGEEGDVPTQVPLVDGSTFDVAGSGSLYPPTPGQVFRGWSDGIAAEPYKEGDEYTIAGANVNFTAVWGATTSYTITLDAKGGSVASYDSWTKVGDVYSKTLVEGTTVPLLAFTKAGLQLMFFRDGSANEYTGSVTLNSDMNLSAIWGEEKEVTIYSWESPSGTAIEEGGVASYYTDPTTKDGGNERVNYANTAQGTTYHTICLNGGAGFADKQIKIALDQNIEAGDEIKMTAYFNTDNTSKKASAKMYTEAGAKIFDGDDLPNIYSEGSPVEQTYTALAGGTKDIKMTRLQTGSNTFITKLVITGTRVVEVKDPCETPTITAQPVGGTYNWNEDASQSVTASVTDGGTLKYQWYKKGTPDAKVGTNSNAFTPTESGTYYVIVTNTKDGYGDADKKSDEVAVTINARPSYKVAYYDGSTKIGEEDVLEAASPAGYEAKQTRAHYGFVAWYNNSDLAEEHKIANIAALSITGDINVYGKWTPLYAETVDFSSDTYVKAEKVTKSLETIISENSLNYTCGGTFDKSEWGTTGESAAYQGYKFKDSGVWIEFLLQGGKRATVLFGSYGAVMNVKIGSAEPVSATLTDSKYVINAAEDVVVRFTTTATSTVTLKTITIGEIPAESDDATLKDLKVGGATVEGFAAGTINYYVELPYGSTSQPEVTATANDEEGASVVITQTLASLDDATITVTAEDGIHNKVYTVHFTVAPKLGVEVFTYTPVGSNGEKVAEGYKGGTADINLQTSKTSGGYKLGSIGHYIGIIPTDGLKENDIICINIADLQGASALTFFDQKEDGRVQVITPAPAPKVGMNYVTVPADMDKIYLYRADGTCNPSVISVSVYRLMAPFIESFEVAGVAATISGTAISAEVPAVTDVTALTPTVKYWANGGGTIDKAGVQDFTDPVTYTVSSSYAEDATGAYAPVTYTVTVTKAAAIKEVVISGMLSVLEDETTTLSAAVYDTNDHLAANQNVVWTVKSGDEDYASVDANGVVTGKAVGTAHIIATSVADDTKSAQVEVAVSENPCRVWSNPDSKSTTYTIGKMVVKPINVEENPSVTPYSGAETTKSWKLSGRNDKGAEISFSDGAQFESLTLGVTSNGDDKNYTFTVALSTAAGDDFEAGFINVTVYESVDRDEPEALINVALPAGQSVRAARVFRQYRDGSTDYGTGSSQYLYYIRACKKELIPLTSVSVADMSLAVGVAGTPAVTLNPANADVASYAWTIVSDETGAATINAATGALSSTATGAVTVKVSVTDVLSNVRESNVATINIVNKYLEIKPVTGTTIWNWEGLDLSSYPADGPTIQDPDTILANYFSGAEWERIAGNVGGRPYRNNTTNQAFQGHTLYFETTVPGIVCIYGSRISNDQMISVNGHEVEKVVSSKKDIAKIVVPAGKVYITAQTNGMRIYRMKFDADLASYDITDNVLNGYTRDVTEGRYGTICLPNGGVMVGAELYEIAYKDLSQNKIFFDQIVNGEMIAGRPYVFLPKEGTAQLAVYYTDNAAAAAGNYHGLYGFIGASSTDEFTIPQSDGNYIIQNNQYREVQNGVAKIVSNRAYLKMSEIPGIAYTPLPGRKRMSIGAAAPAVATGVEDVQGDNVQCTKVLINGQLFILRGEKMYDAKGQLVK